MEQSVASMFDLYLARSDLRPASVRFKQQAMKYFIGWFGDMPVGKVTTAIAEDYRSLLVTKPMPNGNGGRGLSKRAANGYLANLKPFFSWLRRHGRIDSNPFDGVKAYKLADSRKETFTPSELGRLLRVADDLWRIRICLGLLGCRRGEMLAIVAGDVRLDDPGPHVLLSEKKAGNRTYAWAVKNHAIRYIALPAVMQFDSGPVELHRLLRERIATLPADQPYVCLDDKYARKCAGKDDVFDPTGNFQRMFRALQRRAGIQSTRRYHELRAAFATAMIDAYGIGRAAKSLGHASIQTTAGYDRKTQMSLVADMSLITAKCYCS
jgi:integrase